MKILQAVGLGVGILILQQVMGETFSMFELTLQQFFVLLQSLFSAADTGITSASATLIEHY
jgi:hypothetical protein